jgi:NADPH-dependent 2,4-dienoyl-CoA reductase/sulfur reductase-like enzyme
MCALMSKPSYNFEVLVVGAGPAGIAATCAAAESGKHVGIVDAAPTPGGQIWLSAQATKHDRQASAWLRRFERCGGKLISSATVVAQPRPGELLVETDEGALELGWQKLVLATGARELFLPFPGWTLPNVLGAGGLQAQMKSGLPVNGKKVVVAGSGPLLFAAAYSLRQSGADVRCIAEQAPLSRVMSFSSQLLSHPGKLRQSIQISTRLVGVPYHTSCWPVRAEGMERVESVSLTDGRKSWTEPCDYLACGFGLVPNVEMPLFFGCALHGGVVQVNDQQETSVPGVFCAGEPTGVGGVDCALVEGEIAGLTAAGRTSEAVRLFGKRRRWHDFRRALSAAFRLREELKTIAAADTLVCRCEDVSFGRLCQFSSWREAKLQTRCGMGPCQGRICGAATRTLFGWGMESVRPPVLPSRIETLAMAGEQSGTESVQ